MAPQHRRCLPTIRRIWNNIGCHCRHSHACQLQVHTVQLNALGEGCQTQRRISVLEILLLANRQPLGQASFRSILGKDEFAITGALNKPSTLLLTAAGKVEANAILGESQIPQYISGIVQKDSLIFPRPAPGEDTLFDPQN
uniref:Uncharacterized protein n=1 Tax=Bionectria ochroleuca TaxID=29856 RepID=A0A0B7JH52_BIOOC